MLLFGSRGNVRAESITKLYSNCCRQFVLFGSMHEVLCHPIASSLVPAEGAACDLSTVSSSPNRPRTHSASYCHPWQTLMPCLRHYSSLFLVHSCKYFSKQLYLSKLTTVPWLRCPYFITFIMTFVCQYNNARKCLKMSEIHWRYLTFNILPYVKFSPFYKIGTRV